MVGVFLGCSNKSENVRVPANELYQKAMIALNGSMKADAEKNFKKITVEHPGTRLATLAYLKIGDLNYEGQQWAEAETNYRLYLTLSPKSQLVPYVIHKLISLNYEKNLRGLFFKERKSDVDMEPNRKIVQEYQRFFLLYPQNAYLEEVQDYLLKARSALADYEFLVGNYYLETGFYGSAISRYSTFVETLSRIPQTKEVGVQLMTAYRLNQQANLAQELQKVSIVFPRNLDENPMSLLRSVALLSCVFLLFACAVPQVQTPQQAEPLTTATPITRVELLEQQLAIIQRKLCQPAKRTRRIKKRSA